MDAVDCPGGHHHGDHWSYWVRDPKGSPLSWWDVVSVTSNPVPPRYQYMIEGRRLPLETDALRARFPGARITVHSTRPTTCNHDFVAFWAVHRDCAGPCEELDKQRETEGHAARKKSGRSQPAWAAELDELNAAQQREDEADDRRSAELQRVGERYQAALEAGGIQLVLSEPELASYYDDLTALHQAQADRLTRHLAERDAWRDESPYSPSTGETWT